MIDQNQQIARIKKRLAGRHRKERRLKLMGIASICFALGVLMILLSTITANGITALRQAEIRLTITIPPAAIFDTQGQISEESVFNANWNGFINKAVRALFPDIQDRRTQRQILQIISAHAGYDLKSMVLNSPELADGKPKRIWVKTSDEVDQYLKGRVNIDVDEKDRRLKNNQIRWVDGLYTNQDIRLAFNKTFFTASDSREPESAGILGAVVGSAMVLAVCIMLSLPLAVMAAIYLEYFAPKNRLTDFIEVNINNLAAVPSIVFGLLGLAVFLGFFGLPRSAPLVGGMVLALMTLPTIIIATRASIRAVPPSISDAALALGASRMQAALHHVVPLAAPGILTGTIIGMAQALGETAPLLMIGMVAFIVDVPASLTSAATALPVQIFMWADSAERAFYERSSLAIVFLVFFLIMMNLLAVILRQKFEKRW